MFIQNFGCAYVCIYLYILYVCVCVIVYTQCVCMFRYLLSMHSLNLSQCIFQWLDVVATLILTL